MPTRTYYRWSRPRQRWEYVGSDFHAQMECVQAKRFGHCIAVVHHTRLRAVPETTEHFHASQMNEIGATR